MGLLAGCQSLTPKASGRVIDAENGVAVAQAEVRVADDVYEADGNGRYALYLGAGEFSLEFWAPGYVAQPATLTLGRWDLRHVLDIALTPRTLAVTLLDETTEQPISGAALQWGELVAETDAQGAVTMRLAEGQALAFVAAGYRDATLTAEQLAALLATEQAVTPLTVALTPRTLSGRVLDGLTGEASLGPPSLWARVALRPTPTAPTPWPICPPRARWPRKRPAIKRCKDSPMAARRRWICR